MKAIKTKYIGPTNTKPSRCSASDCDGHRVTLTWDQGLDAEEMHRQAALALCERMGWRGKLVTGSFPDCYVHVFAERRWKP